MQTPRQPRLRKKAFLMCRASGKPHDNIGPGFVAMVAGTAERNQIVKRIGSPYAPRNDVVNIQAPALAAERRFLLSAGLALVAVARSRGFSLNEPVGPAPVVDGCPALPLRAFRPPFGPSSGSGVAGMAAESAVLAIKSLKGFPAMVTVLDSGLNAAPPRFVVAGHVAKSPRFRVIGESFKLASASLAILNYAGFRLTFPAFNSSPPRRPPVRPGALATAIFSAGATSKWLGALGACVMDRFHAGIITRTGLFIKYFDIACRRVEEATRQPDLFIAPPPKPVQEGLDL